MTEFDFTQINDRVLDQKIDEELKRWEMENIVPVGVPHHPAFREINGITVNVLNVDHRLRALLVLLFEKEIITEVELIRKQKEITLMELTKIREHVQQMKRESTLAVAQAQILGPNGKPIKH